MKKFTWHKIAEHENELQWASNGMCRIEVAGKKICLSKSKESIHACAAICPHASGNLDEGFIDALGNIVCPVHHYRFNISNGRNTSGEGYYLRTYPLEFRPDGIYIGIEEKGLLGWLK